MVNLLRNVVEAGTARGVSYLGFPVAGKTGTTNDAYDAWFMGFSRDLVAGVWVGYDRKEGPPLGVGEQGSRTALPIWRDYMSRTMKDHTGSRPFILAQGEFEPPHDMIQVLIDPETGLLARPTTPNAVAEYYIFGTEPTEYVPDGSLIDPDQVDVFGADVEE
jgi:penicillin-binding protein 1A